MSNTSTMMALAGMAALGWFGYKYMTAEAKPTPQERARRIAQENLSRAQAAQAAQPKRAPQAPVVSAPPAAPTRPATSNASSGDGAGKAAQARDMYRNLPNRSN